MDEEGLKARLGETLKSQDMTAALAEIVTANATIMAFLASAMVESRTVSKEDLQAYLETATKTVEVRYKGAGKVALAAFREALPQALSPPRQQA